MAGAASPPEERESATHMLIVVGSALMTSMPSRSGAVRRPAVTRALHERSVASGMYSRLKAWIRPCRRTEAAARASSLVGRLRPERRKMPQVAPHATVSSGRSGPPRRPNAGYTPARLTAAATPTRKYRRSRKPTTDLVAVCSRCMRGGELSSEAARSELACREAKGVRGGRGASVGPGINASVAAGESRRSRSRHEPAM